MNIRALALVACLPLLAAAASAPVMPAGEPIDVALERARAEAEAADKDAARLERAAGQARDEAGRLAAERQAAAAAVAAAEARISEAEARLRLAEATVAARVEQLARRQAPLASLLAGIVSMGRRPPLLGIADDRSLEELVRMRMILDATLPVIRARTAALSGELAQSRRLEAAARRAAASLAGAREALVERQQRFAALEEKALASAASLSAGAIGAGDLVFARRQEADELDSAQARRAAEQRLARELLALPPLPARPGRPSSDRQPPIAYLLPVDAPVIEGIGSISGSGIRARGIRFAARRGDAVQMPAEGTIAFAGPFRDHDGIVILDHGEGWMTLLTGVRTSLAKGERLRVGERLGTALGPVSVELSTNGTHVSAALIAGSSQNLSNRSNNR